MNQLVHQFSSQFQNMLKDGSVEIPHTLKEALETSVDQVRANLENVSTALTEVNEKNLSAAKSMSAHVIQSATTNIDAASTAMLSVVKATSIAEAQKIQMSFASEQFERSMKQSQEFFNLATKAYKDAAAAMTSSFKS